MLSTTTISIVRLPRAAVLALLLASCNSGGGGSLSLTENTEPGTNAFRVSQIADIDLSVNGAQINEDDDIGATVGLTAYATDEDPTENDVSYALTDDADGRFSINPETGVVTLSRRVLAAEGNQAITVMASSIDGSSSTARFVIRVRPSDRFDVTTPTDTDSADNAVDITANVGATVGITANAVDEDISESDVSYALSDNAGARFQIDANTGIVTVARSLTTSTEPQYGIEVMAMSEDGSTSRAEFTITIEIGTKPIISVRYPAAQSLTDASTITLRGQVRFAGSAQLGSFTAAIGSEAPTNITVNNDNTWSHQVSLTANTANQIELELIDNSATPGTDANTSTVTIVVTQFSEDSSLPVPTDMNDVRGLALDSSNNVVYVVDNDLPGIYRVDLSDNSNTVFSSATGNVGTGPAFSASGLEGGIVIDSANNRLLLTDNGNDNIVAVSLATGTEGDRTVFSGSGETRTAGAGEPSFATPFGMALDATAGRVFVTDTTVDGVIAVELSTGARSVISSSASETMMGTGTSLGSPRDVVIDASNSRLLVIGTSPDELVAVETATGNRAPIAAPIDNSIEFDSARALALDAANATVYIADFAGLEGIASVDIGSTNTGTRAIISNVDTGSGPTFSGARGIVLDSANNRLIVADSNIDRLVFVDIATGNRSLVEPRSAVPPLGGGPELFNPTGIVFDEDAYRLLVVDDGIDSVLAVNLGDGDRSVIADSSTFDDTNANLAQPRGLAWNFGTNSLLIPDNSIDGVIAIDPADGSATVLSSDAVGMPEGGAPAFTSPRGHIASESADSILLADTASDALFRIDTTNGNRTALAVSATDLDGIQSVILDSDRGRALAVVGSALTGTTLDAVVAVALDDGAVSVVSSMAQSVGAGPEFSDPRALIHFDEQDSLLVLDVGLDALVEVELSGSGMGDRAIIADEQIGAGDLLDGFGGASGLAFHEELGVVYVVNESYDGVLMIDLETGDQVVISR